MSPKQIKDQILKATGENIGTYTLKNGVVIPAVSIGNPDNDIKVSGVEIVVPNFPRTQRSTFTSGSNFRVELWDVSIIRRKDGSKSKFYTVIDDLMCYFTHTYGNDVPQNSQLGTLPQYNLTIRYHCLKIHHRLSN